MIERSILPKMIADLPRVAREEGWNKETIRLACAALEALIEIEQQERSAPAPEGAKH